MIIKKTPLTDELRSKICTCRVCGGDTRIVEGERGISPNYWMDWGGYCTDKSCPMRAFLIYSDHTDSQLLRLAEYELRDHFYVNFVKPKLTPEQLARQAADLERLKAKVYTSTEEL